MSYGIHQCPVDIKDICFDIADGKVFLFPLI